MTTDRPPADIELPITTPRLRLTPMVLADADDLFRVLDDARLHDFTGGTPLTRDELKARIAKWQSRASPDQTQLWLNWVVRIAATGTIIRYVQASVTDQCATIAYVTRTAYSG